MNWDWFWTPVPWWSAGFSWFALLAALSTCAINFRWSRFLKRSSDELAKHWKELGDAGARAFKAEAKLQGLLIALAKSGIEVEIGEMPVGQDDHATRH